VPNSSCTTVAQLNSKKPTLIGEQKHTPATFSPLARQADSVTAKNSTLGKKRGGFSVAHGECLAAAAGYAGK